MVQPLLRFLKMPPPTATLQIGHLATATLALGHRASAALVFEQAPTAALRFAEGLLVNSGGGDISLSSYSLTTLGLLALRAEQGFTGPAPTLSANPITTISPLKAEIGGYPSLSVNKLTPEGVIPAVAEAGAGSGPLGGFNSAGLATIGPLKLPAWQPWGGGYFSLSKYPQVLPAEDADQ